MAYFRTYHEYSHALHHDDRNRIFFIRADCHPFHRQHSMDQNSPEDIFTLGEYLGREQYGTRPLFYGPAFSSKVALDVKTAIASPPVGNGQQVCPQREDFSRLERLLHRTSGTYRVRICAEYALPAYVQFLTRPTLQAMGGRERP